MMKNLILTLGLLLMFTINISGKEIGYKSANKILMCLYDKGDKFVYSSISLGKVMRTSQYGGSIFLDNSNLKINHYNKDGNIALVTKAKRLKIRP